MKNFPTPQLGLLDRLSAEIKNFPISGLGVTQLAEHKGYDNDVVEFVRLFSDGLIFKDRKEFVGYCGLIISLLQEEFRAVPEIVSTPQG